ncbi:MAG: DMT family transporter [Lachnospiraceae bacterium]|nr:DMT family transporter [Candidatus Colinaster equi]
MWFVFTIITTLAWGTADLFYKKGQDENDKYSFLKTSMIVGIVMGAHAIYTLLAGDIGFEPVNLVKYLPVSSMYILSMTVGYLGLKYLELSISSPIQNSSGAVCCIMCLIFLGMRLEGMTLIGVILVCVAMLTLGVLEKIDANRMADIGQKKYRVGFVAIILPVIYCILDSLGTFFDAYYLDDVASSPLVGVTENNLEDVANVSYELTFLICAVLIFIFLMIKKQKIEVPKQKDKLLAAVFETCGQATYVYALSANPAVAAAVISCYAIVSLILSRIFLKEKLSYVHYIVIAVAMVGIAILGVADA